MMLSGFAEEIIARAVREGVVLYPGADGRMIHYEAYERPLAADLRTLLLEHKPAILSVLSAGGIQSLSWGLAPTAPLQVDGVRVVICQTYAQAEACIREMIQDAAGKPVALDLETAPIRSERERLSVLQDERKAINDQAIADRKAAKKEKASQAEIAAITAGAEPKLKVLDQKIAYAKDAGLDPHRAERSEQRSSMPVGLASRSLTCVRPARRPSGCSKASPQSFTTRPLTSLS